MISMVSQSYSSNLWKSILFSKKWRENSQNPLEPDIHGTSPPGCLWWFSTNKTSTILWMVRPVFWVGTPREIYTNKPVQMY